MTCRKARRLLLQVLRVPDACLRHEPGAGSSDTQRELRDGVRQAVRRPTRGYGWTVTVPIIPSTCFPADLAGRDRTRRQVRTPGRGMGPRGACSGTSSAAASGPHAGIAFATIGVRMTHRASVARLRPPFRRCSNPNERNDIERGCGSRPNGNPSRTNPMTPALPPKPTSAWPAVIVAAASGVWGLYWLPLRALHDSGVPVAWVPTVLYVGPCLLLAVAAFVSGRSGLSWRSAWTGMLAGIALAFYTDALILTEVVRALIFFYLTPVWSTILEKIFLGTRISPVRILSIVIGFSGIAIAIGVGSEDVLSHINAGDVMALASGIAWAWATLRIYSGRDGGAVALSAWFLGFGALAVSCSRWPVSGRWAGCPGQRAGYRAPAVGPCVQLPGRAALRFRDDVGGPDTGARFGGYPAHDRGFGRHGFGRALGRGADRCAGSHGSGHGHAGRSPGGRCERGGASTRPEIGAPG